MANIKKKTRWPFDSGLVSGSYPLIVDSLQSQTCVLKYHHVTFGNLFVPILFEFLSNYVGSNRKQSIPQFNDNEKKYFSRSNSVYISRSAYYQFLSSINSKKCILDRMPNTFKLIISAFHSAYRCGFIPTFKTNSSYIIKGIQLPDYE